MHLTQPAKNKLLIIYKLLADILFLMLAFFATTLVVDSLVPGLVSSHISFLKILTLLAFNLVALYAVGTVTEVRIMEERPHKKTVAFLTILAALMIFNGLFDLNLYLNFFLLITTAICGLFLYKLFFKD